jgi:hypothetical protein
LRRCWTFGGKGSNLVGNLEGKENEDRQPEGAIESALESALRYTGRGAETVPANDAPLAQRTQRVAAERARLEAWARKNDKIGPFPADYDTRGQEHTVSFSADQRVIKATRPEKFHGFGFTLGEDVGATPSEYLDRLNNHNRIFGDDIQMEYVALTTDGALSIVTSQPFIKGREGTQIEIDQYMAAKKFQKIKNATYYNSSSNLAIHDLWPKNTRVDSNGILHPIDSNICRIKLEMIQRLAK